MWRRSSVTPHLGTLTECNVAVRADAAEEELDAAQCRDLRLVAVALCLEVRRVAVEDVDVGGAAGDGREGGKCARESGPP